MIHKSNGSVKKRWKQLRAIRKGFWDEKGEEEGGECYGSGDSLHKKWSFSLWISPVNVTKSAGNCEFGYIYWRNP